MAVVDLGAVQRAAVRAFAQKGYAATGIRDIADYAGVTSGALYYHARNKEEILASVMRLGMRTLLDLSDEAVAASADPAERVAGLVRLHVAVQATNPRTCLIIDHEVRSLGPENREAILAMRDSYENRWTGALTAGLDAGLFRLPDLRVARLGMLEMCNGVAHWYRPDGPMDMAELQATFVQLVLAMAGFAEPARHTADPPVELARLECEPVTPATRT